MKKFFATITAIALLFEGLLPFQAFAAGTIIGNVQYLSPTPSPSPARTSPGSNVVLRFVGVASGLDVSIPNPYVEFRPTQSEYSFVSAGSGYVSVLGVPTYYASSGLNPPTSFTGVISASLPIGTSQFGFTGTTVSIPTGYPHKTFDFSVTFGATGLVPYTKTGSVAINVVPHLRSVTFSKASLVSNGIDNAVLSVNVLDRNGCSNIASVMANLSQLGGSSTESLSFQSCAGDGVTATYVSSQITTLVSAGLKTVSVTAYDAEGHANASDAYFSSDDLASSATVTVNSPTAPVVTVNPIAPALIKGGVDSSVTWSSSQTGTYLVYAGPSAACGSGTSIASGNVVSADSNIVTPVPSSSLSEGSNRVVVCVTNMEPTEGSAFSTVTKDSSAPTVSFVSSNNNIVTQNVTANFSATETGTYRAYVNGSYAGVAGSYDVAGQTAQIVIPNSAFTIDPGNNALYVTVTDAAGNVGYSFETSVYKDGLPPDPVSSASLVDCDYVGNSATPCGALGNPRSGMSGRDFRVSWTPVSESTATTFESYQIFVLPEGQAFTSSGLIALKTVPVLSQSGVSLDSLTTSDSLGNPFASTGSANYVAYVRVRKSNGLSSSETATAPASITADTIEYPSFVSASFVSNTEIALTYSKALSASLSDFDSSKISSASSCFIRDSVFGTGAASVSGSVVRFKIEPLGNPGKTCADMSVLPGSVKDFEGLYDEDVRTGLGVSDSQSPTVTISSPANGAFVGGAGSLTLAYSLAESMSGATLFAKFTDGSGSVVSVPLASKSSAGNQSLTVSGPSAGLQDGKTYSLVIEGSDISGNSTVSNTVTGIRYDVSPPTVPVLSAPTSGSYVNDSTPTLTWVGSTDNSTNAQNVLYEIQVSLVSDFSSMYAFANVSGTASFDLSPAVTTNTGYYWRVRASDEVGNSSFWTAASSFVFDNVAPTVTAPTAFNVTRTLSGYVRNGDSLRISANASDNLPNTLFATGMLANLSSAGGGASVTANSFNGTAIWNLSVNCSDGNKTVPFSISDLAGNVSNSSATYVCDNTAPNVNASTITYPSSGSFVSGSSQVSVTWNPSFYSSEASPISNPVTVEYSEDGSTNWVQVASAVVNSGNASWTVPSHDSANAKIRLTATDLLSNSASGSVSFVVDSTNPAVSSNALLSPNGGEFLKGSTGTGISIAWNPSAVSDTNLADSPIALSYSSNGGTDWVSIATGLPNTGTYLWNPPVLDSQNVLVKLTATDKVGRTASDVSDSVFVVDSTAPVVTPSFPPTPSTNSFVSGSGFDIGVAGSDVNLAKVSYSFGDGSFSWNESSNSWLGGTSWNDVCLSSAECANYAGTVHPTISDGTEYQLVFRATDKAGNVTDSSSVRLVGDLVAPTVSKNVQDGQSFSGAVSIAGNSSDTRSGVSSVKASVRRVADGKFWDGNDFSASIETFLATNTSNAYSAWSYTGFSVPVADPEGSSYVVTILGVDNAYKFNNETRTGATIFKDSQGPTVASDVWTVPSDGEFWKGETVKTLSWNPSKITDAISGVDQSAGITVEYATGAGVWHSVGDSMANDGSVDWTVPVIDADVTFRISAKDLLGNRSSGVVSPVVTVDSLPPQISTVETMDRSASGKIDGLLVTMSEPVSCASLRVSDFTVSGVGTPSGYSACTGNSSSFVLEFAQTGDTSTKPSLTALPGTALVDRAGNPLAPVTKSSSDSAVPRLLSVSVSDSNANAKVDRITATFSENLSPTSNTGAWSFASAPLGVGTAPVSVSVSNSTAVLVLNEPADYDTSASGMTVSFAGGSSWKDLANNSSAPVASLNVDDAAAPRLVSAKTADDSGLYALDATFSEPITDAALAGFSVSGSSTYSGSVTQVSAKTYRFRTADSTLSDTAKAYSYSYVPGALADASGNLLAAISSTSFDDGVAPKIVSRKTVDSDFNGKIDGVSVTFSESLNGNVSGVSATVSGYPVTVYSSSGTGMLVALSERASPDTSASPAVRISNASLADASGNLFATETSSSNAEDAVGPVVISARYDGTKVVATLSEPFSGTPASGWFAFSGTSVSAVSANGAGVEIEIPVTGTVTYGSTEVSAVPGFVADALGNKQGGPLYVKISASVVINEIMWSGTGSSKTQYLELRNLGPDSLDLSGFKIDGASSFGAGTFVIPNGKSIAGNGYFLIAASDPADPSNLLSPSVVPDVTDSALSFSPSQTANVVLKNASDSVYDRAIANPFPAGNDSGAVSMERKPSSGDGLSSSNWYDARTGTGFFDVSPAKGTPGSANVFDATAPNVLLSDIADGYVFSSGTGITLWYSHSDDVLMAESPVKTLSVEKNDGSGNYSDVTGSAVLSSSGNSSESAYSLNPLTLGAYRVTFEIEDAAGNASQRVSSFYVDSLSFDVSSTSSAFGTLSANSYSESSKVTVTVRTVGIPFGFSISGTGKLVSVSDEIGGWNGSDGFGFRCDSSGAAAGACDAQVSAFSTDSSVHSSPASVDPNGNLKTYSYDVYFATKFDEVTMSGQYGESAKFFLTASY